MDGFVIKQHLFRAWKRHWALQVASVTVMTVVLLILNLLFLGFTTFNRVVGQWSRGLEMIVYLKEDGASEASLDSLQIRLQKSGEFERIEYVPKGEATKKFLQALGGESLNLMSDNQWTSPIPSSFELRLSERIPIEARVRTMQSWASQLRSLDFIEDVAYGQGWVENFSRFLKTARGLVLLIWVLSLSVGLLIVGNCIRLSFLQRRDEIEVLELVGATPHFIRLPFLVEGVFIGFCASLFSILLSFTMHSALLTWVSQSWNFWFTLQQIPPLMVWHVFANMLTGIGFGAAGAWYCVRKLNTGWAAVS